MAVTSEGCCEDQIIQIKQVKQGFTHDQHYVRFNSHRHYYYPCYWRYVHCTGSRWFEWAVEIGRRPCGQIPGPWWIKPERWMWGIKNRTTMFFHICLNGDFLVTNGFHDRFLSKSSHCALGRGWWWILRPILQIWDLGLREIRLLAPWKWTGWRLFCSPLSLQDHSPGTRSRVSITTHWLMAE